MADPIFARQRQIIGTADDWAANDLILGAGELALIREDDGTVRARVGDGASPFSAAPLLLTTPRALHYQGNTDPTAPPPVDAAPGDIFSASPGGTVDASWGPPAAGMTVDEGDFLILAEDGSWHAQEGGIDLAALVTKDELNDPTGAGLVGFRQAGTGAITRTALEKLREISVSITDFGGGESKTAAENTAAFQLAKTYILDRFAGLAAFYPGSPVGDPLYTGRDRRTGRIDIPAGCFRVLPHLLDTPDHPRAPYVGFTIAGTDRRSSTLLMETGGAEAWFHDNSATLVERYQCMTFQDLNFRSDDWRFGNFFRMYSSGGPKQVRVLRCDFDNLRNYLWTTGTGNADLCVTQDCYGHFFGDILTLDNNQSVSIEFRSANFGTYSNQIHVKQHGGGNVTFSQCSMDFVYDERFSPPTGIAMFTMDTDAFIGPGNGGYTWRDCRVEVEAYMVGTGAAPMRLVNTAPIPNLAQPRVLFSKVTFVNGNHYTLSGLRDHRGRIELREVAPREYRRITAVRVYPRKHVKFENCTLLKTFFYELSGDSITGSPATGGTIRFIDNYDGANNELPAADVDRQSLHSRVLRTSGTIGRVITDGTEDHTGGSAYTRKLLDCDPAWRRGYSHEQPTMMRLINIKHDQTPHPNALDAVNDSYLELPDFPTGDVIVAFRIYILKPADPAETASNYQLHLKINDRSGTILGSSTLAPYKNDHLIDLPGPLLLTGIRKLCLCASGVGSGFSRSGVNFIMFA